MTAKEWDAAAYDRVADPQAQWARRCLIACRSMDPRRSWTQSAAMLEQAANRLARFAPRVTFIEADLGQPLPPMPPIDAVLSTAVFHWIPDHDALFRSLAAVLRPGGRLVAQCGGADNIRQFSEVVARVTGDRGIERTFGTPKATQRRLAAAGFTQIRCWLSEEPTRFETGGRFEAFLETVCLQDHVEGLEPEARAALVRAVADAMPEPVLDYVRLNIQAVKA